MANPLAALGAISPAGISGFAPLPVSVMIPFMALQSAVMARAFGVNYEAGKRFVKALDNKTFNNLVKNNFEDINILTNIGSAGLVQKFIEQIPQYDRVQEQIIKEMVKVEKLKVNANIQLWKELPPEYLNAILGATTNDGKGDGTITQGDKIKNELEKISTVDPNSDPNKFLPPSQKKTTPKRTTPKPTVPQSLKINQGAHIAKQVFKVHGSTTNHVTDESRVLINYQYMIYEPRVGKRGVVPKKGGKRTFSSTMNYNQAHQLYNAHMRNLGAHPKGGFLNMSDEQWAKKKTQQEVTMGLMRQMLKYWRKT